jgi:hypothetical protein
MGQVKGVCRTLNSWVQNKRQKIYFAMCILLVSGFWTVFLLLD